MKVVYIGATASNVQVEIGSRGWKDKETGLKKNDSIDCQEGLTARHNTRNNALVLVELTSGLLVLLPDVEMWGRVRPHKATAP
jgi:hypothetical protein